MFSAPARYVAGLPQPRRCLVMGVVNVTPDSFSDGGMWFEPSEAIRHGMSLLDQGADLIDVGGESTRPGAQRTTMDDELRRVLPVVSPLAEADALVSIDTMRAEVARQAVAAGAVAINDVSGGLADPDMMATAAELEVPYVCMHWRGHSASMQQRARYDDVVSEVAAELGQRADAAVAAGISSERLVLDPGLGFAKTGEHNWQLLQQLEDLQALGFPILVAASRKGFLGTLLAEPDGTKRPVDERDDASATLAALAALAGVWCVRAHDVPRTRDAVCVASRFAADGP